MTLGSSMRPGRARRAAPAGWLELAVPGEHNRRNAATALAALDLVGVSREDAEGALPDFAGAGRRLELRGEQGGVQSTTTMRTIHREVAATPRPARSAGRACAGRSSSRTSTRERGTSRPSWPERLQGRHVAVTRVYAAREQPVEGVDGTLVVEALATEPPGIPSAGCHARRRGPLPRRRARPATWCSRSAQATSNAPARCCSRRSREVRGGVALSRHTTLGTGGPAKAFARPESVDELEEALRLGARATGSRRHHRARLQPARRRRRVRWARAEAGRRARRGARRRRAVLAGGGAATRSSAPRARRRARRPRVRVRDPGHDRRRGLDERRRLRQRLGSDARRGRSSSTTTGARWLTPEGSASVPALRAPPRPGRRARRVPPRAAPEEQIKANVAELQALRKAAQPTNKRTFGSVFKNPEHELSAGRMLEACGLKGHRIGGAQISPRHANFIENADGARQPTPSR